MDPATVALVRAALDVAFLIGSYYMRRAETDEEVTALVSATDEIRQIRSAIESGDITAEDGQARLERIGEEVLGPLRVAIGRL